MKRALWENRRLKFIAITQYKERAFLFDIISAGFKSFVFKDSIYDELGKAIDAIMNNRLYFPQDIGIEPDNK